MCSAGYRLKSYDKQAKGWEGVAQENLGKLQPKIAYTGALGAADRTDAQCCTKSGVGRDARAGRVS